MAVLVAARPWPSGTQSGVAIRVGGGPFEGLQIRKLELLVGGGKERTGCRAILITINWDENRAPSSLWADLTSLNKRTHYATGLSE